MQDYGLDTKGIANYFGMTQSTVKRLKRALSRNTGHAQDFLD